MQKFFVFLIAAIATWWFISAPSSDAVILANGSYAFPGYVISNAESYTVEARVLSRENYYLGRDASLSPTDLALGWGRMADEEIYSEIEVSQRGRWYYWRSQSFPIPRAEIISYSATVHMVPASESVAVDLARVSTHDKLRLTGKLVDIQGEDGWHWNSSRSRTDTGNGSCELMLLERIDWL